MVSAAYLLVGCGETFHYTDHLLCVKDGLTNAPLRDASVTVKYAPVYCGGPFAFLGKPNEPTAYAVSTNADGCATIPLEMNWPYGFDLIVSAAGYEQSAYIRPRRMGETLPTIPMDFGLKQSEGQVDIQE